MTEAGLRQGGGAAGRAGRPLGGFAPVFGFSIVARRHGHGPAESEGADRRDGRDQPRRRGIAAPPF
jgi:hypothetical protein